MPAGFPRAKSNSKGPMPMTTTTITASGYREGGMTSEERMVIFASSLGTVFEWYDFYIYGTLGADSGEAQFFSRRSATAASSSRCSRSPPVSRFARSARCSSADLGDLIGRKYTFLITMSPDGPRHVLHRRAAVLRDRAGIMAPVILIALRLFQGLALGGEYGGAAIYVAEHAPQNKRGYYTSWIQTTATVGLFMALLLVLGIRTSHGRSGFAAWGWRIPFLLSAVLLAVSIWIRLKLNKSPVFQQMKEEGKGVQAAADRGLRQLGQPQDRDPGAARRHRRRGRGLVRRPVLRAVLPDPDAESARRHARRS